VSSAGRILVVEDNPAIVEIIGTALIDEGYDVVVAWNGALALEQVATFRPDLIILDMWLPLMSGQEFWGAYRKASDQPAPIVVISASQHLADVALVLGAACILHKPFDLKELLACVKKHLPAPGSEEAVPST
jgi:DNA-binding response OmpR family regulator